MVKSRAPFPRILGHYSWLWTALSGNGAMRIYRRVTFAGDALYPIRVWPGVFLILFYGESPGGVAAGITYFPVMVLQYAAKHAVVIFVWRSIGFFIATMSRNGVQSM